MQHDPPSSEPALTTVDALDLLDWKRRILRLYGEIRATDDPRRAWQQWNDERDRLYRDHPQSPVAASERASFAGCDYFDYDARFRTIGELVTVAGEASHLPVSTGGTFAFTRIGLVRFELLGARQQLELQWNAGYGGGLFLAFRDGTSGRTTYGGGRYLFDTVKGSDLGFDRERGELVLDFNFAYNPSCSYDARWACPLAPAVNVLPLAVTAGEKHRPTNPLALDA